MQTSQTRPPLWNVPYQQNPFFTGREDILRQLHQVLHADSAVALSHPQGISGLGGIGKTQTALEYAYRYGANYDAVFWVQADSAAAITSSYVTLAHLLHLPERDEQDQNIIIEAVLRWLHMRPGWLLVFDSMDDLSAAEPFLPKAGQGYILFTTRAHALAGIAQRLEIQQMEPETGALLLLRRASLLSLQSSLAGASSDDRRIACEISQELDGLPLALDQAGAYVKETPCPLVDYLARYRTRRQDLLQARGNVNLDYPASVATTWSLSLEKISQANPAAVELLNFCAYLSPEAIPEDLLTKGASHLGTVLAPVVVNPLQLDQVCKEVLRFSLFQRGADAHTLTIHRLVQAVLRDSMPLKTQQQWMQRVIGTVNAVFPDNIKFQDWPTCDRLLPHALVCALWIEQLPNIPSVAAHLLNEAGYYLQNRSRYAEAEPLYQRALVIREQQLGTNHRDTALSVHNLASLYYMQGKYAQVEPLYRRALTINEQQLGSEHPDVAKSLNNLAMYYSTRRKYAEAESLLQRALTINEQQLGGEHPDVAGNLNNLAELYQAQGKYAQAEPLHRRALTINEQQLGGEHPDVAKSLHNLAALYNKQGRYGEAEPLLQRALAITEQQLGEMHTDTGITVWSLARAVQRQGHAEEAKVLYERAFTILEHTLGPENLYTQFVREHYTDLLKELSHLSAPLHPTGPPIWHVPFARNPFFTGRDELLERLHTQLETTRVATVSQPHAVSGLGGIGKTQLALEYAYRYGKEYQAVLWARADTTETLNASYTEIAQRLQLLQREAQEQEVTVQTVKGWLSSEPAWLLILDNADKPEVLTSFLPSKVSGQVLVTTQASTDLTGLGLRFGSALAVETFTDEVGALFLLHRSDQLATDIPLEQVDKETQQCARELAHDLGGLPLALDQAGAYLKNTKCGLAVYQQIYEKHRTQLLKERRSTEHPASVAITWQISCERIEQDNPAAADLLRFCAFLAPDAIPEEILSRGAKELGETLAPVAADPFLLHGAIESLRVYALMNRDPQAQMLSVHRLVQAVVRDSLPTRVQQQWIQRAINAIVAIHPGFDFVHWPALEQWLPHALVCATWSTQAKIATPEAACLLNQAGRYLHDRMRYAQAEPLYQRALAIREQQPGARHPDTAMSLNNLAELYRVQGKYAQAEPLYLRALPIREQQLGTEHPDVAQTLNNLALLYHDQGRYADVESLHLRALSIRVQQLGTEHPNVAQTLNNLAELYRAQGKYAQAEPLYLRALSINERAHGPEHPDVITARNNLANLYHAQGKYTQAEPLLQRALAIREQQLGAEHPAVATSLNNLAALYYAQGKYAQAEPLLQRALAIREHTLGPGHPETQAVRSNYAALLDAKNGQ